jgi:hypothetical protein
MMLVTVATVAGCENGQTQTVGQCGDGTDEARHPFEGGAGGSGGAGGEGGGNVKPVDPCAPYVETVLPAMGLGDVHVVCDSCGSTCDTLGEPCGEYGAPCEFDGVPGVCVSCCQDTVGELHCKPTL